MRVAVKEKEMTLERLNQLLVEEGYVEYQAIPTAEDIIGELHGN
jgi:hypothetical protein